MTAKLEVAIKKQLGETLIDIQIATLAAVRALFDAFISATPPSPR